MFYTYIKTFSKKDLVNKFVYPSIYRVPKLDSITLHFTGVDQGTGNKKLFQCLSFFEVILNQKGSLKVGKKGQANYLTRSTAVSSAKLVLRKQQLNTFLDYFFSCCLKGQEKSMSIVYGQGFVHLKINNFFIFDEITSHYDSFSSLPPLCIDFSFSNDVSEAELKVFLKSLSFPNSYDS